MAESEGFEPPIALRLCLISSQVHSTGLCQLSALSHAGSFTYTIERLALNAANPASVTVPVQLTPICRRRLHCEQAQDTYVASSSQVTLWPSSSPTVRMSTSAITSLPAKLWPLQCHVYPVPLAFSTGISPGLYCCCPPLRNH